MRPFQVSLVLVLRNLSPSSCCQKRRCSSGCESSCVRCFRRFRDAGGSVDQQHLDGFNGWTWCLSSCMTAPFLGRVECQCQSLHLQKICKGACLTFRHPVFYLTILQCCDCVSLQKQRKLLRILDVDVVDRACQSEDKCRRGQNAQQQKYESAPTPGFFACMKSTVQICLLLKHSLEIKF